MEKLYNKPSIVGTYLEKYIRIRWAGHVWRSEGLIRQITSWKMETLPRQRRADILKEDLRILGVRYAGQTAKDRED